jgi:hypothetical protein
MMQHIAHTCSVSVIRGAHLLPVALVVAGAVC